MQGDWMVRDGNNVPARLSITLWSGRIGKEPRTDLLGALQAQHAVEVALRHRPEDRSGGGTSQTRTLGEEGESVGIDVHDLSLSHDAGTCSGTCA